VRRDCLLAGDPMVFPREDPGWGYRKRPEAVSVLGRLIVVILMYVHSWLRC
jgi:hypothetical protein